MSVIDKLKSESLRIRKEKGKMASFSVFMLSEIEKVGKNAGNRATTEDEAIQAIKKQIIVIDGNIEIAKNADQIAELKEQSQLLNSVLPTMENTDNEFVVKKNSWHYNILYFRFVKVNKYGINYFNEYVIPRDFCTYWRLVFTTIVGSIMVTAAISIIIAGLSLLIYNNLFPSLVTIGIAVGIILAIVLSVALVETITRYLKKRVASKLTENTPKADGLFTTKYKSWKQKYCPKIVLEEN